MNGYLPQGLPQMDPDIDPSYAMSLPGFSTPFEECVITPHECPNENITFWLYTKDTQHDPTEIDVDQPNFGKKLPVDHGRPWVILIHGYTGHKDFSPNKEIRPAYFKNRRFNIISVDYEPIAREPCYYSAVQNVPTIANCTARMLDALIDAEVLRLPLLHVIGYSLGGQIAGHLKLFMKHGPIKRLTALDPALPLFLAVDNDHKVDSTDADFVQVIHTNAGWKGQFMALGHVDFYPNGGYGQPGCKATKDKSLSTCNHDRAPEYFAESINSMVGFYGVKCFSMVAYYWGWCAANETEQVMMGEYTPATARGSYYLSTHDSPPFALGPQIYSEE